MHKKSAADPHRKSNAELLVSAIGPSRSYHNHVYVLILTLMSSFAFLSFGFCSKAAAARVDGCAQGKAGGTQAEPDCPREGGSSSQGWVLRPPLLLTANRTQTGPGCLVPG